MCERFYQGVRQAGEALVLGSDGTAIDPRTDLVSHSKRLEWSYGGPAPAQTALAVLADYLGGIDGLDAALADLLAMYFHRDFERRVIANLPYRWVLDSRAIDEFRAMQHRHDDGRVVDWSLWRCSLSERGLLVTVEGCPTGVGGPSGL